LRSSALKVISTLTAIASLFAIAAASETMAATGGAGVVSVPKPSYDSGGGTPSGSVPAPTTPAPRAVLSKDGRTAIPPASAPAPVKNAIYAANRITNKPYRYGGGHRRFRDRGYDCSGAVSYALHGGGILDSPLFSTLFMRWGEAGRGQWITVYSNPGHAYVVIAGLRFDTSGPGERGPRWRAGARSSRGYVARHPEGL
jgi:cell wall-associated NlpC family hydrolase